MVFHGIHPQPNPFDGIDTVSGISDTVSGSEGGPSQKGTKMALTDVKLRNAKPKTKPYKLADGGGLYVLVTPKGTKSWRYDYRLATTRKTMVLGTYPEVSLLDARKKHLDLKSLVIRGIDPAKPDSAQGSGKPTFLEVAEKYIQERLIGQDRAKVTIEKNEYFLYTVAKCLHKTPIDQLQSAQILALLKELEGRGQIETAHRLRTTIGSVCRYAISQLWSTYDPVQPLRGSIRRKKVKSQAAITDEKEFGELLRLIWSDERRFGSPVITAAPKLSALCYPRPGELRMARWSDIDLAERVWTIPEYATKMRRAHDIPLSLQAYEILLELRKHSGKYEWVFPQILDPTKPISENAVNQGLRRLGVFGDRHVAHGFRSSASTILNDRGFDERVVEVSLAHIDPSQTRRAYNRALYWDQRSSLLKNGLTSAITCGPGTTGPPAG